MEQVKEREYITQVKRRILEARKLRGITSDQVFVKHSLRGYSDVHHELGGEAALAYLAVIGTHQVASELERKEGYIVRVSFQAATCLGARQFRRGLKSLARVGYIEAATAPGRKPRVRLTTKGRQGLAFVGADCTNRG